MKSPENVLLIGATGGIGSALARRLTEAGHRVLAASRRPDMADTSERLTRVALDLDSKSLRSDLQSIHARYPDIGAVIHCAGQNRLAGFDEAGDDELDRMLRINLRSAMTVAAVFVPILRERGEGSLMFVGSMLGSIGMPGYTTYCATKFGLRGYFESLRREVAGSGVRVQYVAPRATRTGMNSASADELNARLGNAVDDPEQVAGKIMDAWLSGRARTFIGGPERFFSRLNALFPALLDNALGKQAHTVRHYLDTGDRT